VKGLRWAGVGVRIGARSILSEVELQVSEGEFVALVGPNGSGKSTLLKVALGLVAPSQGTFLVDGRDAARLSARQRAAEVGWLPQQALRPEALSALEEVVTARFRFDEPRLSALKCSQDALLRVGGTELAERAVDTLSGGEQQRVALAGVLAQEPRWLLVDEPANHLDPAQQTRVYGLLGRTWRAGLGIVCVTHDFNLLRFLGSRLSVRVVGLAEGRVAFDLPSTSAELKAALSELFAVPMLELTIDETRLLLPSLEGAES